MQGQGRQGLAPDQLEQLKSGTGRGDGQVGGVASELAARVEAVRLRSAKAAQREDVSVRGAVAAAGRKRDARCSYALGCAIAQLVFDRRGVETAGWAA